MWTRVLGVLLPCLAAAAGERPLWIAAGPAELVEPLGALAAHRRTQGLDARVVAAASAADALEEVGRPPAYLLLVGDAGEEEGPWRLPTKRLPLYRWRPPQARTFASDPALADLDGDALPDLPVGRIPARTPEQVRVVVAKILAYEGRAPDPADLRLAVWAGAPGYGGTVDAMATTMLVSTVRQHAPPWASPWLLSADARQALCGWPPDQPAAFAAALREGALLGAIASHGDARTAYSMRHEGAWVGFGAAEARAHLDGDEPTAPVVVLACNCGEFDGAVPSLAETLLFLPGGPVATIGATTESHPLPNFLTGVALLDALAGKHGAHDTLGDLWFRAQREAAALRIPLVEAMLKDVEGKLEPEIDTAALRRDQQRMYALLGDPALRLRLPGTLAATVEKDGGGWRWRAEPCAGATRLHVGHRPLVTPPAVVPPGASAEVRRERFAAANAAEGFTPRGSLPADAAWEGEVDAPGWIRLVATGPGVLRVAVLEAR